jgi:hypothetical protein
MMNVFAFVRLRWPENDELSLKISRLLLVAKKEFRFLILRPIDRFGGIRSGVIDYVGGTARRKNITQ